MAKRRSVTKRRGGSRFATNKLTLRQRVIASERLAKKSNISTAAALKQINKAQADREKRIKKRKGK